MHSSVKARLTSVAIRIRISDPDCHENLIICFCSLAHCQPSLKISCKSVCKFLRKVANRQTDKQRRKRNLLGGGNNKKTSIRWQDSAPPRASNGGQPLCVQISRERSYSLPIYWYHSKGNWLRYNFAADSFYIMKLCSRLLVLYCWNCPKDDKFRYLIPSLRKLGTA